MNKIKLRDINLMALQKLKHQGTKATLYKSGDTCFKILDGLTDEEKEQLYQKFLDMDVIELDDVLLPRELIMQDGKLQGYTMDYFADAVPLSKAFLVRYVDCRKLFNYVIKASKTLRMIHSKDIICQDLSFENILVNNKGEIAFCDLDGCHYKEHISPFISALMKRFLIDYRDEKIFVSPNLDRI